MKFVYEYRTKNNELRDGMVVAADREAAFSQLKAQGIRPARLSEAPGIFNKLFGRGKRWILIAILMLVVAALATMLAQAERHAAIVEREIDNQTRRQVIGDAAIISEGLRTGWKDVFSEAGDRFLASFAVPGVAAAVRSVAEQDVRKVLAREVVADAADGIEVRQIKAMVSGVKAELRTYLQDGGTIREYGDELVRRQEREVGYFNRAKEEVASAVKRKEPRAEVDRLLKNWNERLRKMGIGVVVLPENASYN